MRKKLRVAAAVGGGLLLLIAVGGYLLVRASQQVPQFYRDAMAVAPAVQRKASDQMLRRATALVNEVQEEGHWQALFTAEQINGWLAVDLVENHPQALPPSLRDPRVAIDPSGVTLGCRFHQGQLTSVLSLAVEPYLPEPNVLALRICRARAGTLPVPLGEVLDRVSAAAGEANLHVHWRQIDGDPVVFIAIPQPRDQEDRMVQIESLHLGEDEILLTGSTSRRGEHPPAAHGGR
ncbi:MAG: hypothetical protein JXB62_02585 [Pirellulales bacterium]|nr:hypothetical protein [Pirellulales bacterium]